MKRDVTARELATIHAICEKELIGQDRRDLGMAKVAAAFRGGQVKDYMPVKIWRDQTAEEDFEALMGIGKQWEQQTSPQSPSSLPPIPTD